MSYSELYHNAVISNELDKLVKNYDDCNLDVIADELIRIGYTDNYDEAKFIAEDIICNELISQCDDSMFFD